MKKPTTIDPTSAQTLTDADKVTAELLFLPEDDSPITTPPMEAHLEEKTEMSDPKTPNSKTPGFIMTPPKKAPTKVRVLSMQALQDEFPDEPKTPTKPPTPKPTRALEMRRGWLLPIAGAATFFIILAVIGGVVWWFNALATAPAPVEKITEATPVEEAEPDALAEAEAEVETVAEPEPVVEAASAPASSASPALEPTNCTFMNGNRPQVGDKYVLTCAEGEFIATGEYKGGGIFAFSAFEPHNPSK